MKTKYNPATARQLYTNASGSRAVMYWEQCGNFACPVVRIKGKATKLFPDSDVEAKMWMPYAVKYPTANKGE